MKNLQFNSVTKYFPGVIALDKVSFDVGPGECHALVGENGAGKSTLGKILAGIYQPDEGNFLINGREVSFPSPFEAKSFGVSIVHQELAFCPNLSIAENLFLGNFPGRMGFINKRNLEKKSRSLLAEIGMELDIWQIEEKFSIAQRQMAQVAAAVGTGARIIIMDEPTSAISQTETEKLFDLLKVLRNRGVTVIYISHRLEEIFKISDRITVLRDGRYVKTVRTSETNEDEIVRMMVGRSIDKYYGFHTDNKVGEELLSVKGLNLTGKFENISFSLHAGEILGFAGLVGAGRSEIAQAIFGLEHHVTGDVFVGGQKARITSPVEAMARGIGLVPEDRKQQGLILGMSAGENLSLAILNKLNRFGFIKQSSEGRLVSEYLRKLSVKPSQPQVNVSTLSGGNQQKVILAKWLARNCKVLIVDEPTRGIDVKAKQEIHTLIGRLAAQGKGILLISSELPELLNLSTRILVIKEGEMRGEFVRGETSQEALMRLMVGVKGEMNEIPN